MQWFQSIDVFLKKIMKNCRFFAFSTLFDENFSNYRNLLQQYDFTDLVPSYPSVNALKSICEKHGKLIKYATKRYDLQFKTPFELVKYFRKLGAAIPQNKINILSALQQHKSDINLNYELFFSILEH
jgi:hypothetical protein